MTCEGTPRFDLFPLQLGMPSPWHVIVASLTRSVSRKYAAQFTQKILDRWRNPSQLALASVEELRLILRRGTHAQRIARSMIGISKRWHSDDWRDLRDLPGVTVYIADCVQVFCFQEYQLTCTDKELHTFVKVIHENLS